MKTVVKTWLLMAAIETRKATDFQKVAANNIKVSYRQADRCGKYNDKQLAYCSPAAFDHNSFPHLSTADPPFTGVHMA